MRMLPAALALALAALALAPARGRAGDDPPPLALVEAKELLDELKSAPRENPERVERLRALYLQAGAKPEEIRLREVKSRIKGQPDLANVVVTLQGETDRVIVVGGHLDKVEAGDGIIDDWSGACMAANVYQALKPVSRRHTFIFVGFAHEEQGLVGSRAFVASLSDEQKAAIDAMVNLECLGPDDAFLWTNGSTDALETLAHRVADRHGLPLRDHVLLGVGADSIPFEQAGIPVLTFDGLPSDKFDLIHSKKDVFENVRPESYVATYSLVVRFLHALDAEEGRVDIGK